MLYPSAIPLVASFVRLGRTQHHIIIDCIDLCQILGTKSRVLSDHFLHLTHVLEVFLGSVLGQSDLPVSSRSLPSPFKSTDTS